MSVVFFLTEEVPVLKKTAVCLLGISILVSLLLATSDCTSPKAESSSPLPPQLRLRVATT
ncbi:MAG: hypothetical protein HYY80_02655 [Chloroflexi bacterium]|nr:hypothetical protein [Chloroflexota bacterium]